MTTNYKIKNAKKEYKKNKTHEYKLSCSDPKLSPVRADPNSMCDYCDPIKFPLCNKCLGV